MGKKSKRNSGPRFGSERAEKLARREAERELAATAVTRPFAGIAAECDLVAMREFVPSATAVLPLRDPARSVTVATVLPGAVAALVREVGDDPEGFVGVQVQVYSDDLGGDLAASIAWAQTAEAGESLQAAQPGDETPALADLIDPDAQLDITVHQNFDWWIPEGVEPAADVAATVQHANEAIMPSARVQGDGVVAAWWVDAGEKAHIRWVRPEDEDELMLALARVHATGDLHLGEGSRFAGSFRTQGLLVPVFDLDREKHPDEWAPGLIALARRLEEALAVDAPLTSAERRARDGLRGRQVTLVR
ncbi:hypothetical protein G4H71_09310 [Rhodococcus triatomae]|uniref:DUF5926 domain-containing protein n=1 Tax=Rhodococcus triatomae TaxID=300028 RepID=A0A1G8HUW9_9NOCA|nr:DUF5926 family protein [Rhodococcus triatomae]QNG20885.1 hypothetical protein G4H72_21075 [Rhodococcus triatomae]QNG23200.1 hypothetical protein G4H71_09310 [Rhodococcus triatomae]SDI10417.1 hypothetical protein SAMN05444695_10574 [Rhodococcus triatomae]